MDAQEQDRLFRQPIEPLILTASDGVVLQPPMVHGIPPVSATVGEPMIFEHVVEDDGTVEATRLGSTTKRSLANRRGSDSTGIGS